MTCPAFPPATGFVSSLLNYIDCQAQTIGAGGFQALGAGGSSLSLVLTGFITILIAIIGYRMLFGETPQVRDGVLALVKIGIVLALATSWAAYRTLVYDVALQGPAQLASDIGRPAALPGSGGGLVARLDNADRLLVALIQLGPGDTAAPAVAPAAPAPPYLNPGPATGVPPPGAPAQTQEGGVAGSGFDSIALGASRILYLTGAAGALAALRMIAGVLLALGPFFFAFLLFDGTRGLFEGWLRVLAGTALGALGTAVALGVELVFIEPRLAYLISLRQSGYAIPGAPVELFVIMLVFALAILAMVIASARVAYGFRMPLGWRGVTTQIVQSLRGQERVTATVENAPLPAASDRSRAVRVADAVAATQRREGSAQGRMTSFPAAAAAPGAPRTAAPHSGPQRQDLPPAPAPLGRSHRRTHNRASRSADRRDRGS